MLGCATSRSSSDGPRSIGPTAIAARTSRCGGGTDSGGRASAAITTQALTDCPPGRLAMSRNGCG
eukprot:13387609-Alexandrium_andersonii.AAC.1